SNMGTSSASLRAAVLTALSDAPRRAHCLRDPAEELDEDYEETFRQPPDMVGVAGQGPGGLPLNARNASVCLTGFSEFLIYPRFPADGGEGPVASRRPEARDGSDLTESPGGDDKRVHRRLLVAVGSGRFDQDQIRGHFRAKISEEIRNDTKAPRAGWF